ncbi:nucleotide-diphospho-sugar transferase [Pyronema domesticum]|uniref:dolichyl-phosphate beta-glucosyltransferase n=1 Tax=Pyronema omphalodes (strain CBS 100304) TaxID=1076935 RepID=U4L0F5_PYROM|nr:nucleotide-diphospho-sugar transferase [Pyronema domesticum]CCX08568.1 Similar to Dolichyl-phosphate beta-glucosyltransferase; acc. no. O60061 [Pyronema omphalodes CBS 100304]
MTIDMATDLSSLFVLLRETPTTTILTALVGLLTFGLASAYFLLRLIAHHPRPSTEKERFYRTTTPDGIASYPLPPAFTTDASCYLSVIVPAYNETERLPAMLEEAINYLRTTLDSWEILIVDDGSKDRTCAVALEFADAHGLEQDQLRVISLEKNRGKGGAVTHGMRHCRGEYAIFADADGASQFSDLEGLMKDLKRVEKEGYGIAVGSRAHMVKSDAVVKRSFVRNFLMHSFHTLLKTVGVRDIKDTQCGFKLFSRKAVKAVFEDLRTEGWIFDIEILLLAGYKGIPVVEVPVNWHEVDGTKVNLVSDSIRMARDLGVVRAGYAVGVYTIGRGGPGRE